MANALSEGFDGVEIVLPGVGGATSASLVKAEEGVIAVAAACRSADVACGLAEVSTLLRMASANRASCLNLTIPPVDGCPGGSGFLRYQDGLNFAYRVFHDLRHQAEADGVTIAIEAAAGGCLLSPVELREIINQANSPYVGVCLDVPRVSGIGVAEDWIATLGYRIKSIRVGSTDKSARDSLAVALDSAGCDGPLIIQSGSADG